MSEKSIALRLENLTKKFGDVVAVDSINLDIYEGEILTLLGPSGCGKSTTLRAIAGLDKVSGGEIYYQDRETKNLITITDLAPRKRDMAMVFQSYALWPHMTVYKNIEFGMTVGSRQVPKGDRKERIVNALKMVSAEELVDRKPSELSGGQQQRIAVARAIVVNPSILLLDEPFSNLDAKLRVETRSEIRTLIKKIGFTAIFVTHDQSEALSISDRIAIMNEGRIEQVGSPLEIWLKPHNSFVGAFIGEANLIECKVGEVTDGYAKICLRETEECFSTKQFKGVSPNDTAQVILRPQSLDISREKIASENHISAKVIESMFMGTLEYIKVELASGDIIIIHRDIQNESPVQPGEDIYIKIDPDQAYVYGGEYRSKIVV